MSSIGSSVFVWETFNAVEGEGDALEKALGELLSECQKERGCLSYEIFRNKLQPQRFVVFMQWENEEAYVVHGTTEYMKRFVLEYENKLYDSASVFESIYRKIVAEDHK